MDNSNSGVYFEFIRYCIDEKLTVPNSVYNMDWECLFLFMQQQALLGVGFIGIARLRKEGVEIPRHLFLQWFALSERIKSQNILVNRCCVELTKMLNEDGLSCCILKGQGNTIVYPHPYARTPGDIDIFVMKTEGMDVKERRRTILSYVRKKFPQTRIRYQHIDYPVFPDVEVEMHFIPTAKNNPIYNCRIQQWAEKQMPRQCRHIVHLPDNIGIVSIPTTEFNVIYQMSHLMHHFFDEGIGLRQMMDYYFVLQSASLASGLNKEVLVRDLKYLGLYQFAGAVMYVMQQVFGMEEAMMVVPVDEKRGKTLMGEILKGGNFGKHSGLTRHSTGVKYFLKIQRNLRFVREYPSEALCEPVFRTWHFFWRLCH